jgi:hypothetical protein
MACGAHTIRQTVSEDVTPYYQTELENTEFTGGDVKSI